MELEQERKSSDAPARGNEGSTLSEVAEWLGQWPEQRQKLRQLIDQRAEQDPAYSWLTAERELVLMDGVMQRIQSIIRTLSRPVPGSE